MIVRQECNTLFFFGYSDLKTERGSLKQLGKGHRPFSLLDWIRQSLLASSNSGCVNSQNFGVVEVQLSIKP